MDAADTEFALFKMASTVASVQPAGQDETAVSVSRWNATTRSTMIKVSLLRTFDLDAGLT